MADYSDEKQTAYDEIKNSGAAATISRWTEGDAELDPTRDKATLGTWTAYGTYGVLDGYSDYLKTGTSIRKGDKKMLVPSLNLDITPQANDRVIQGGTRWKIEGTDMVAPSNDPIMYILQLRS